jgi:hypothetical protein
MLGLGVAKVRHALARTHPSVSLYADPNGSTSPSRYDWPCGLDIGVSKR